MKTYTIECPNCGNDIEVLESSIVGEDIYYDVCSNCNCDIEAEVQYDIDDNIVDLYVY